MNKSVNLADRDKNKEKRNYSSAKRNIRKLDHSEDNNRINHTQETLNPEMSDTYKNKLESEKEKRECEERIKIMKNHISAMKRQQEDMDKKLKMIKRRENNLNEAKKQKENTKKAIYEYNINRRTELENKRKKIERQREIENKCIKESTEKTKKDKIRKYRQYQKEREEAIKLNESENNKAIHNQIEKIKSIRETNKNIGINRRKILNKNYNDINEKKTERNLERTKKLREEIKKLQTEENAIMEKLNQTKNRYNTYASTDKYEAFGYNKYGKNSNKPSIKTTYDDN